VESGQAGPGFVQWGWLNRAIEALPRGERIAAKGGLAVGASTPLILRGSAPVLGWAPHVLPAATDDLAARVLDLYAHRDPVLQAALIKGIETEKIATREGTSGKTRQQRGSMAGAWRMGR